VSDVIVIYESLSGNAEAMAQAVAEGARDTGFGARVIAVEKATNEDLLGAAGIVMGCYTSYGILAGGIKTFLDKSFTIHGKLQGKAGGAFATSGGFGGGTELTVLSILQAMLVHGMVIEGDSSGTHFGAVAVERPREAELDSCRRLGKRVGELAKKLGA
jgi:NAD(P)H dehydrogenase (quinone)